MQVDSEIHSDFVLCKIGAKIFELTTEEQLKSALLLGYTVVSAKTIEDERKKAFEQGEPANCNHVGTKCEIERQVLRLVRKAAAVAAEKGECYD